MPDVPESKVNFLEWFKRLIRAAVAGFLGGAAAAAASGAPITVKSVVVTGGVTGLVMAVGKAVRDTTGVEFTP